MPKAFIMCGVPGSGKSTHIEKINASGVFTIISTDEHVERHAAALGKTYDEVFKDYMPTAIELMNADVDRAIEAGESLIWDQTNLTPRSRSFKFERLEGYEMIAVVLETPPFEELKRRLDGRSGKKIPDEVVDSMVKNFVPPTLDEGFKKIVRVSWNQELTLKI